MIDEKNEVQRAIRFAKAHNVMVPKWVEDLAKKHKVSMEGVYVIKDIPYAE